MEVIRDQIHTHPYFITRHINLIHPSITLIWLRIYDNTKVKTFISLAIFESNHINHIHNQSLQ